MAHFPPRLQRPFLSYGKAFNLLHTTTSRLKKEGKKLAPRQVLTSFDAQNNELSIIGQYGEEPHMAYKVIKLKSCDLYTFCQEIRHLNDRNVDSKITFYKSDTTAEVLEIKLNKQWLTIKSSDLYDSLGSNVQINLNQSQNFELMRQLKKYVQS